MPLTNDQLKRLAELDGWTDTAQNGYVSHIAYRWQKGSLFRPEPPNYATDYNAIIGLIQKLSKMQFIKFVSCLLPNEDPIFDGIHTLTKARKIYFATPEQLCLAILEATNQKEKE